MFEENNNSAVIIEGETGRYEFKATANGFEVEDDGQSYRLAGPCSVNVTPAVVTGNLTEEKILRLDDNGAVIGVVVRVINSFNNRFLVELALDVSAPPPFAEIAGTYRASSTPKIDSPFGISVQSVTIWPNGLLRVSEDGNSVSYEGVVRHQKVVIKRVAAIKKAEAIVMVILSSILAIFLRRRFALISLKRLENQF